MKILEISTQRIIQGTLVAKFPAEETIDDTKIRKYYDLERDDPKIERLAEPCVHERLVIKKSSGSYVIVPNNPTRYYVYPGE